MAVSLHARACCYAPCRSPMRHVVGRWCCIAALVALYHDPESPPPPPPPPPPPYPRYKILYRCPQLARLLAVSRPIRPPPSHDTNLYRDSPWPSHAHALLHTPRAGRPYRRPYRALIRSCRGLSRLYRGQVPCACCVLCYPVSRYKNCIGTQIEKRGSSPSSFISTAFIFFFLILATGKPPKKKIFFFHFPV